MSEPDFLPLSPGLRLEYEVRRAGGTRRLVVSHEAAAGGAVLVRRTWAAPDGSSETETTRAERRAGGVYFDGELVLPLPARPGAEWSHPPRAYRLEALEAEAETPAGRFPGCLRVSYLIAAGDGGCGERLYAPGVGLARELCGDEADPFEVLLTAFSRGAAEAAR
ncbi:MAG TPA: hypothetical protein VH309_11485 [Elusimicrobiota bacterium]|nr:hypothetical protein [Elusimicrobiota bacterium]